MKRFSVALFWIVALAFAATGAAAGQASPSFDLRISALGGGGGYTQSANFAVESVAGLPIAGSATAGSSQIAAGLVGLSSGVQQFASDSFEADDSCPAANPIAVNGPTAQVHSFHREGDQDWLVFAATANKTHIVEVVSEGPKLATSPAILSLYNDCGTLEDTGDGSFGTTVRLEYNAPASQNLYLLVQQLDPTVYGAPAETRYTVRVLTDGTPPGQPLSPRCEPKNPTTIGVQWTKSPQRDVAGYRIQYSGNVSGSRDVPGKDTTYFQIDGLTAGQTYQVRVQAFDFSGNESPFTGQFPCIPNQPEDLTDPVFQISQPGGNASLTTSAPLLTFTGDATDAGGNLARARVTSQGIDRFDDGLTGSTDTFRVENVPLAIGENTIAVTVADAAGNQTSRTLNVRRLGQSPGAVLIIAGHNESFGLQSNIYFMTNRAYRIFKSAGYDDASIFYLAPVNQDADGDGTNDVDAITTPANIENTIKNLIKPRVGPDKPLFFYLADHGFTEKFCATGCTTGAVTAVQLDTWLRALESSSGLDEVNIVIEACQSGSFLDRAAGDDPKSSLSKAGRVVISSTGRLNNAYASAQGGYFSDAFFSCLVDSNDLKTCFDEGRAAVLTAGVAQTPWLDDNGDGGSSFADPNTFPPDGSVAQGRVVTQNFSSNRPDIVGTSVTPSGTTRTLTANLSEGAEDLDVVWASIYPPDFVEPTAVTLNLGVPTVRLEEKAGEPGVFEVSYNGFVKPGAYRVIFYAQDAQGIAAIPRPAGYSAPTQKVYLPTVQR